MDFGYLMCSTLRCDTNPLPNTDDDIIVTKNGPPDVVESSGSEFSSSSDQQQSSSVRLSQVSSSSIDASSNSLRTSTSSRGIKSGHTSPSSLALQRRPKEPPFYLKKGNPSADSTTASADNSIIANSSSNSNSNKRKNGSMAIACQQPGANALENGVKGFRDPPTRSAEVNVDIEETKKRHLDTPAPAFEEFCLGPSPLRSEAWSEPSAEEYQIRSKNYMRNGIKEASERAAFRLITVDLINSKTPIYTGMCAHPGERVQMALERERTTGFRELPEFIFAVNLCIPADTIYHAVFYYGIDKATMDEIKNCRTAFGRVMNKFMFGDSDDYRNQTFKLIPRVVEGNYIVRKGVGTKPAILGKKIKQCYVRGGGSGNDDHRYFEIIVDIASDPVAKRITKLCLGYIKTIAVEMMFALEGHDESTLPERIFGGAAVKNLDFKAMDGKRTVR